MTNETKHEAKLRQRALRYDLRLTKSRRRDVHHPDFARFALINNANNFPLTPAGIISIHGCTLDEIEAYLHEFERRPPEGTPINTRHHEVLVGDRAARHDMRLVKSRRRKQRASDFGRYALVSNTTNLPVTRHGTHTAFGCTLDQIEAYLNDFESWPAKDRTISSEDHEALLRGRAARHNMRLLKSPLWDRDHPDRGRYALLSNTTEQPVTRRGIRSQFGCTLDEIEAHLLELEQSAGLHVGG